MKFIKDDQNGTVEEGQMEKESQAELYDNEADANRQLCFVNLAAAVLALLLWAAYLLHIFTIPRHFFPVVCVLFPVASIVLLIPLFFIKTEMIRRPGFKYFILFSLLVVIAAINITIPKHAVLLWPFAILFANHYYNPKIGRAVYIVTIVSMLVCMYTGMFFGEFDQNLLGGGVIDGDRIVTVETFEERKEMLDELLQKGNNRYIKVFVFYYLPRAAIITLFFLASNILNKRTYHLFGEKLRINEEFQKTKTELNVAKDIQESAVPTVFPEDERFELYASMDTAEAVGGDFYDFFMRDEKTLVVVMADVSGKGMPAALYMMRAKTLIKTYAEQGLSVEEVATETNKRLCEDASRDMFVTAWIGFLELDTGVLSYVHAGHTFPVLVKGENKASFVKNKVNMVLGGLKKAKYVRQEITLDPGDSIFLYTDGVTEAHNEDGDMYGDERLLSFVTEGIGEASCKAACEAVLSDVNAFVGGAEQFDDITMMRVEY
ncbi:MAG: serine/threonine-protein phosphatase, partial [Lachnospiraceae bacterium]|nr:serine/threonine-protein phosphatase [Lachnospiraceae bacterium]